MIDGESTSSGLPRRFLSPSFLFSFAGLSSFTGLSPLSLLSPVSPLILLLSSFFFHFITFLSSPLYLFLFPQCLCGQCACMHTG